MSNNMSLRGPSGEKEQRTCFLLGTSGAARRPPALSAADAAAGCDTFSSSRFGGIHLVMRGEPLAFPRLAVY